MTELFEGDLASCPLLSNKKTTW